MKSIRSPSREVDLLNAIIKSNLKRHYICLHSTTPQLKRHSDRSLSTPPRILPHTQNLKTLPLPNRFPRNLHPLLIHDPQAPPTNRLEPLPAHLSDRLSTAPAFAVLVFEFQADDVDTLGLVAAGAKPAFAVPLFCLRAGAAAGLVLAGDLLD